MSKNILVTEKLKIGISIYNIGTGKGYSVLEIYNK